MAKYKRLMAGIGCKDGAAVCLFGAETGVGFVPGTEFEKSPAEIGSDLSNEGADGFLIYDFSATDEDHERTIGLIREAARVTDVPIYTGGRVKRLEDVKKYLYAGAKYVFLSGDDEEQIDLIREAAGRFGPEKIYVTASTEASLKRAGEFRQLGAAGLIAGGIFIDNLPQASCVMPDGMELFAIATGESTLELTDLFGAKGADGVVLTVPEEMVGSFMELKYALAGTGLPMDILTSTVSWSEFKTNADGLIPTIVQDYKTSEVLMMAYMNEQAFADTLRTGKMHYYSRSRRSQWMKGETSGHFQYVRSLHLDCDNDTLLAKVHQVGAACHTGSRSCFFQTLAKKEYREENPLKVFEDVFALILDRKEHPKEGSYTNYLFDKGIDKILKKVGEEATEINIAAKNPDPEEIRYEISD
ncbi:MAG: bifunctional phosphoribosyl-AMP cyclohydrolase/phosphoribosyl-ATP diphosphatase HisIE, partial [Clostridiales bacterium]|nr:bifunctional phosphoribosyl-AMP cyclohydrolase/phosphoribosyl-ATP diphosphatase HisIE [Clostridiales bacterium]